MEAHSFERQTLYIRQSPLDEDFVREAVTISRLGRGEWGEPTFRADYEAEVARVTQELNKRTFLIRGFGALAMRFGGEGEEMVGYGYGYEKFRSVWFGGMNVVPDEVGKGVLPAIAQFMLATVNRDTNRRVIDPNNVLPPLLAGALEELDNPDVPEELPSRPRIADVQRAIIQVHPHLAEYNY